MEWLRWKHGTVSDARLTLVKQSTSLPRYLVIAAYAAVKEYASGQRDRGSLAGFSSKLLAATIECEPQQATAFLKACENEGLLSRASEGHPGRVLGWEDEQGTDPSAADRMKALRARKKRKEAENGQRNARNALREPRNGSDDDFVDGGDDHAAERSDAKKPVSVQSVSKPERNKRNALRPLLRERDREKEGQKEKETPLDPPRKQGGKVARKRADMGELEAEFEATFWPAYRRKTARKAALPKFVAARAVASLDEIMAGLRAFDAWMDAAGKPASWYPHASSWLNGERWRDELPEQRAEAQSRCGTAAAKPVYSSYYDLDALPGANGRLPS